jgi:hypothetical protein
MFRNGVAVDIDNVPGKPGSKRVRRRNLVAAEEFGALACWTEFCDASLGHNQCKTISEHILLPKSVANHNAVRYDYEDDKDVRRQRDRKAF